MDLPTLKPMPLNQIQQPFDHDDWLFEMKYDGFCALAHVEDGKCELSAATRSTTPGSKRWPKRLQRRSTATMQSLTVRCCASGWIVGRGFMTSWSIAPHPIFAALDRLYVGGQDRLRELFWARRSMPSGEPL